MLGIFEYGMGILWLKQFSCMSSQCHQTHNKYVKHFCHRKLEKWQVCHSALLLLDNIFVLENWNIQSLTWPELCFNFFVSENFVIVYAQPKSSTRYSSPSFPVLQLNSKSNTFIKLKNILSIWCTNFITYHDGYLFLVKSHCIWTSLFILFIIYEKFWLESNVE